MLFDTILGQDAPKELLCAALARGRLAHTYLFSGPDGVGKTLFAREVARALLCKKRGECHFDTCAECHMIQNGRHPDLLMVQAEEEHRFIRIEQAREALIPFLSVRPVQAQSRVVIVREAERMNEETANSLLKTLEEPPLFATIILTTSRPRALPDTIRSRCQELRFAPLSTDQLQAILTGQTEFNPEAIRLASRFAHGSAGTAINLLRTDCLGVYSRLLSRILALPNENFMAITSDILSWAASTTKVLELQREKIREIIRLIGFAYRDILLLRLRGETHALMNLESEAITLAAQRLNQHRILQIIETLWEGYRQINLNASPNLVLDNLFGQIEELQTV